LNKYAMRRDKKCQQGYVDVANA